MAIGRWWELRGLSMCPSELISQSSDKPTCRDFFIDRAGWRLCEQDIILKACALTKCTSIYIDVASQEGRRGSQDLCRVNEAVLILSLFWSGLATLIFLLGCTYCVARYAMSVYIYDSAHANNKMPSFLASARHGWEQATKWIPWGMKLGALLGLGVFWFDKATDVKLLLTLSVNNIFFWILLALLMFPYVVQGYINVHWLKRIEPVKQLCSKSCLLALLLTVDCLTLFVPSGVFGMFLTIALDVLLFISDLGFCIPVVDQHANLEEYQPFRDMGRAFFGTLPTVIVQSVVLTLPVKPANDIGVSEINTFILAFVAAGLQLLKVFGETFYLALRDSKSVRRTFWQSLAGTAIIKEPFDRPFERQTSELVSLPQQQPSLSSQDEL